jgi:hypothetical protein
MHMKKKWFQFSLRFLVLVTFLLGPALGTWIYYNEQQPSRNAAFAFKELTKRHWTVECEWVVDSRSASWWGRLCGIGPLPRKCVVRAPGALRLPRATDRKQIPDEEMRMVAMLGSVDTLSMRDVEISPEGMKCLGSLRDLRFLVMENTSFGDSECRILPKEHLTEFWASKTKITDLGLSSLSEAESLAYLEVDGTNISDTGLSAIGKMKELKDLDISECQVTNRGISQLSGLTKLEKVNINHTLVTEGCLQVFDKMPKVHDIRALGCNISENAADRLAESKRRAGVILLIEVQPPSQNKMLGD